MPNDLIRYDLLVQEALCGVVSRVLADVARNGLPGDHHFYITFRTQAPGVRLSSRMREQYPDEMTIILQHQFEDLRVSDHGFEVGLSFRGVPEILLIPFDALTGFFDPSVQFSLKFEPQAEDDGEGDPPRREGAGRPEAVRPEPVKLEAVKPQVVGKPQALPAPVASVPRTGRSALPVHPVEAKPPANAKSFAGGSLADRSSAADKPAADEPAAKVSASEKQAAEAGAPPASAEAADEAKVVSIDAFRKKP